MLEFRMSSAVVTVDDKPRGILTSKDILMRVIAQDLPPESTLVEKVMTPNPECASVDTPIVDALHTMHDGKFLHLPVVDRGNLLRHAKILINYVLLFLTIKFMIFCRWGSCCCF
nr:CBS domain-containing protein CBSCBSPB1 [Ipomoea batatas]